jgi:hypothetical protein
VALSTKKQAMSTKISLGAKFGTGANIRQPWNMMCGRGSDSSVSEYGPLACFCEHGNEHSVFIKGGNFLITWATSSFSRRTVRRDRLQRVNATLKVYYRLLDTSGSPFHGMLRRNNTFPRLCTISWCAIRSN